MTIVCIVAIAAALAGAGYAFPKIVLLLVMLAIILGGIFAPAMANNTNVPVQGTTLVHGTAGGTPATAFAGIDSIDGLPELAADEYETTRIDQVDMIKRWVASLGDSGEFSCGLGFVKANIATLYTNFRVEKSWLITFVDGSKLQWDGFIKRIRYVTNKGNEVKAGVVVRVSGPMTFTPAP